MPEDSFTSAPSAAFLGCHQSQPHSHSSKSPARPRLFYHKFLHKHTQPGSTVPVNESRQQNDIFQPDQLWDLTPCTDTELYPGSTSSLRCPKKNSTKHPPQVPNTAATSPLSYPHLLEFPANFLPFHWMQIKITALILKYMTYIGMELLTQLPNKFPVSGNVTNIKCCQFLRQN